jgi:hypothetical protein
MRNLRNLLALAVIVGVALWLGRGKLREWKKLLHGRAAPSPAERVDMAFAPQRLPLAPDCGQFTIHDAARSDAALPQIVFPVNMALREGDEYYVCNYRKLWLVDLAKQGAVEVPPPADLKTTWMPTALVYDAPTHKLYVANYEGANVVILDATERTRLRLARVLTHPEMKGPEGVALTSDGKHLAIADYVGNAAMLFTLDGQLQWKSPVVFCHGISCLRCPDGEEFVLATSLEETSVCKFDMKGKLLQKHAAAGWHERDHYMYPTALLTRPDGLTVLTDAFRGQIFFLDDDVSMFGALGGNGPGPGLFNNPYACCWNAAGDRLFVVDSYKDRIVEVNVSTRMITRTFQLADRFAPEHQGSDWYQVFRQPDVRPGLAHTLMATRPDSTHCEAFGVNYQAHFETSAAPLTLPLPRFSLAVDSRFGHQWQLRTYGLAPIAKKEVFANLALKTMFTEFPFRFAQARNYTVAGSAYLFLLSPQTKEVLICGRGVTIPIRLERDVWLVEDTLVGQDFVLSAPRLVERTAKRIESFYKQLAERTPLEAIRGVVFPHLDEATFRTGVAGVMKTPEGVVFVKECFEAKDAGGQIAAAQKYLEACKNAKVFQLQEIFLVEMILCAQK